MFLSNKNTLASVNHPRQSYSLSVVADFILIAANLIQIVALHARSD